MDMIETAIATFALCALVILAHFYLIISKENKKLRNDLETERYLLKETQNEYNTFRQCVADDKDIHFIRMEYNISASDLMKGYSQKKLDKIVRNKLAMLVGNAIAKEFTPEAEGNKRVYYLRVKSVK